jgi:hypothetical protein
MSHCKSAGVTGSYFILFQFIVIFVIEDHFLDLIPLNSMSAPFQ